MKIPFIRVGITLAIGSVVASAVRFYIAMGAAAADLTAPEMPTTPKGVGDWFVKDFLFQGTVPTGLFWVGIALAGVGIARMSAGLLPGKRVVDSTGAINVEIERFYLERAAGAGEPLEVSNDEVDTPGPVGADPSQFAGSTGSHHTVSPGPSADPSGGIPGHAVGDSGPLAPPPVTPDPRATRDPGKEKW